MSDQTGIIPDVVKKAIEGGYAKSKNPTYLTEKVLLPSEGKLYDESSPLSAGYIEIRYPTAKDEDILTSKSLIQNGTVVDVFVNNLIVDKSVHIDDLLIGDKNALVIAARILAYGPQYQTEIKCPSCESSKQEVIDISQFESKELEYLKDTQRVENNFSFVLPNSKFTIIFSLPTSKIENKIEAELKALRKHKLNKNVDSEMTVRLRNYITEILDQEGNKIDSVRQFIENMLSSDSLAFRKELNRLSPNVITDFNFECDECTYEGRMTMPLGIGFFWPSTENSI